jgi:hypothetical protein
MEILRTMATLLPLALTSGINLYATILVAGLSMRLGWVQNTPPGLDVLASWPVIIAAAIFFLMEALADKIQVIDNIWDMIHTFIRPLGAAPIGFAALGNADPMVMIIAAMAAGGIALVSHGGKAGSRVALNISMPYENVTNIAISTAEDVLAGSLTFLALKYPFVASGIGLVILVLIAIFVPQLLRWAWFMATSIFAWLKNLGRQVLQLEVKSDSLPPPHMALLQQQTPELSSRCKAQGIKGANGRSGFISLIEKGNVAFTYTAWFGSHVWRIDSEQIVSAHFSRGALMDVLEVYYRDDKQKERTVQFAFMKDRSLLAEQLAGRFGVKAIN